MTLNNEINSVIQTMECVICKYRPKIRLALLNHTDKKVNNPFHWVTLGFQQNPCKTAIIFVYHFLKLALRYAEEYLH